MAIALALGVLVFSMDWQVLHAQGSGTGPPISSKVKQRPNPSSAGLP
jgi:hypothetical protein